MRVLVDMQGAQGASRRAGVGRYALSFARALAEQRGPHEVLLLVNTALRESAAALAREFAPLLGEGAIRRFAAPAGSAAGRDPQSPRRRLAETLRAEAVHDATPDLLLLTSVFEGWQDDAVTTWPVALQRPATAAILYDLIPLSLRPMYLDGLWREAGLVPWYARGLDELAAAELLLCISEATRAEAVRHLGTPPGRLAVIHGGVDPAFAPPAAPDTALLARLGLRPGYLLNLGAGDPRKNEGLLLDAFALLPPATRARHPLAIGHVNPPHLRAEAARRGLGEAEVVLLPFVPEAELPALYAQAALLVFPSLAEGLGLPLLEAMACGLPVIASRASSMPDLLGRPDLLFDPHDAPALAARLAELLADPEARAEISAYGRRRARAFTWEGTAREAWHAIERTGAARGYWRPLPRPTLALVAPLPPAPSGVADYAAELAVALMPHYAVTLVAPAPPEGALRGRLPWMSESAFLAEGARFDRVLYQVGNNPMHARALSALLPRHPGVVTLHDPVLADLRNWMLADRAAREEEMARRVLEDGYPAAIARSPSGARSAGLLAEALGVLVHSAHARARLSAEYGEQATRHVQVIAHLRGAPALPPGPEARARLGLPPQAPVVAAFGLVTPRQCPFELLGAMLRLARAHPEARLAFVGGAEPGLDRRLAEAGAALGPRLHLTGRLAPEAYRDWLAAADIAVQLRQDSAGETSGAVKDAMMAGRAVVVNAHGAMAELPPETCRMLPDACTEAELAEALGALLADAPARRALGQAARRWARDTLDPGAIGQRHRQLIEEAYLFGPQAGLHDLARWSGALGLEEGDLAAGGVAAALTWPGARPPRLWLDTRVAGFGPGLLALLREGAGGFRPEPCRWEGRMLWTDHAGAFARLGLAADPPPDGPAGLALGDALVSPAPLAEEVALAHGLRRLAVPPEAEGAAQRRAVLAELAG